MHATGSVTIGGSVFGAVEADITLDNGDKYHFVGYYADAGVGVGVAPNASGDFPGESHILGSCFLSVVQAPGGFIVSFDDFHGHIGSLEGVFEGAVVEVGVGGGSWTSASEAAELKAGDTLKVELEHVLVSSEETEDE